MKPIKKIKTYSLEKAEIPKWKHLKKKIWRGEGDCELSLIIQRNTSTHELNKVTQYFAEVILNLPCKTK